VMPAGGGSGGGWGALGKWFGAGAGPRAAAGPGLGYMTPAVFDAYAQHLRSEGVPNAQIAAMLSSASSESGGRPGAIGDGGASAGLFMWHGARLDRMITALGPDWASHPMAQLDFALQEMRGDPKLARFYGERSAGPAGASFSRNFERPADAAGEAARRAALAQRMMNRLSPAVSGMPAAVAPHLAAGGAVGKAAASQVNHFTIKIDGDIPSPAEKADRLLNEINKKISHGLVHNTGEGDGTSQSPWTTGLGGL
jgi:hypothetical protein